jgi:hypothetical protein
MYGAAQIMAVTGHKSVQSLTTYQRVDTEEKIKMGQTLTENVTPVPEQLTLPSTEKLAIAAPPTATHQEGTSRVLQNLPPATIVQDLVPESEQITVCRMYLLDHRLLIICRVLIWRNY